MATLILREWRKGGTGDGATGVKRKPTAGGPYQAYFTDYSGKKRHFTDLTRSEAKFK